MKLIGIDSRKLVNSWIKVIALVTLIAGAAETAFAQSVREFDIVGHSRYDQFFKDDTLSAGQAIITFRPMQLSNGTYGIKPPKLLDMTAQITSFSNVYYQSALYLCLARAQALISTQRLKNRDGSTAGLYIECGPSPVKILALGNITATIDQYDLIEIP